MVKMKLIIIALTLLGISEIVSGQQNNSLYFFDRVPQSSQLNPALQPACTFYMGFPFISSIEINAGNNALNMTDFFVKDAKSGKTVNPLYSSEITHMTLDKLPKNNIVSTSAQLDIISFGFKIKESYLSFLISDKFYASANIPKDLLSFAYEGIGVGQTYTFDNLGLNATYYREYSIGYSQKISDKLYFGVRGKMLFGKANLSLKEASFTINEPEWKYITLSSSLQVNASVPYMEVHTDATGRPDSLKFNDPGNFSNYLNDIILLKKNRGYAIDLGFQYSITDKMAVSASILDLGYINWKANVHNISGGGDYNFEGIDMTDSSDIGKALLDTLKEVYDITASNDIYGTMLSPKMYIGVSYTPNKYIKFSLLSRSEIVYKTLRQQFTGSVTLYPIQFLGATVSYTVADKVYDNLGIGLVFRAGPLQYYLMSERVPICRSPVKGESYFVPTYMKNVNLRLGVNLVFGVNQKRKLLKDQPFLE